MVLLYFMLHVALFIKDRITEQTYPNGTRTVQITSPTINTDTQHSSQINCGKVMKKPSKPLAMASVFSRRCASSLATAVSGDGVQIAWQRYSPKNAMPHAPPLLLVHGFACGKDDWGALIKMLGSKTKREVLSFDHRGVGESDSPSGAYSVDQMAMDAAAVLDASGSPSAHVLGISLGGMIAQSLALQQRRSHVRSLVLGCTTHGGREATPPPSSFLSLCASWAAGGGLSDASDDPNESELVPQFMKFMLPEATSAERLDHYREYFVKHTRRSHAGLQGQLAAMGRFNTTDQLKALGTETPTLVLCGSEDAVMPLANSKSLNARIPGSQLLVHQGAGHFWWAHDPVYVVSEVARFLQRVDDRSS